MTGIRSNCPETTLQRSRGIRSTRFERKILHQTLCERVQRLSRSESCMICIIDAYVKWIRASSCVRLLFTPLNAASSCRKSAATRGRLWIIFRQFKPFIPLPVSVHILQMQASPHDEIKQLWVQVAQVIKATISMMIFPFALLLLAITQGKVY